MNLSGSEHQKVVEAIISAYPSTTALKMMVRHKLDKNLDVIAGGENLKLVVFNLMEWAESQGKLEQLLKDAYEYTPDNQELKDIYNKHFPNLSNYGQQQQDLRTNNVTTVIATVSAACPEGIGKQSQPALFHSACVSSKQKILLLAAFPENLRLDREIREIEEAIKRAVERDSFEIKIRTAVRIQDIRRVLAEEKPQIVHFCGHGMEDGSLQLEDDGGNHKPVFPKALAALFKLHSDYVKCVLLNACYSALPAQAISKHIDYVIGMEQPIEDRAAIVFAGGFYDGLGYDNIDNKDVIQRAFDEGIVAIELENFLQGTIPYLWKLGVAQAEKNYQKVAPVIERELLPPIPTFEFDVITVNAQGLETKREKRQAKYYVENLGKSIALEMVDIPGGKFMMGSPQGEGDNNEHPQHEVTVQPFFMGKYAITQAQWRVVAALPQVNRKLNPDPSRFKGDDYPVESVCGYDVVEFCARLSKKTGKDYRLPSEAEWEYACRAGTTTPFHFGETLTDKLANYRASETFADEPKGKYRRKTTSVGTFSPNAFGLYDMHGNVWEWCEDSWHENYQGAPTDGSGWQEKNDIGSQISNLWKNITKKDNYNHSWVLRGRSWNDVPEDCRSANRGLLNPDVAYDNVGVRVVCAVPARTQ